MLTPKISILQAFLPLFKQFDNNVLAASINSNVDPNVLKDPTTAKTQQTLDPLNIVGGVTATLDNVPPVVLDNVPPIVLQDGSSASKP